jgi:iron complex outermembrane receptor protein
MKNQEYKYYSVEGVYADEKSRFSILYTNIKIENFIYFSPVGFINIDDHTIKTQNWIFDYTYELSAKHKLQLNYYTTSLSETLNNSSKGGYIKFIGEFDKFDYFTSLIYRNGYSFTTVNVPNSYNFNLGTTYHFSKDISISLKGENLLNKSTKSLYKDGLFDNGTNFALEDYQREVTLSMKWVF